MSNVAGAALLALGVAVIVAAAPVGGALLGVALTTHALAGGAVGFTLGALALPLPMAILSTKNAAPKDAGKSRLRRIGEDILSLYKNVGEIGVSIFKDVVVEPLKKKPAPFVPRPDSDDPFRISHLGADFDAVTDKPVSQQSAAAKPKTATQPRMS